MNEEVLEATYLAAMRQIIENAEEVVDASAPVADQVWQLFERMGCSYEIWEQDQMIFIEIEHGDWKHDHGNADFIMETVFGLKSVAEEVTEEDDSEDVDDNYSAIHTYAPV